MVHINVTSAIKIEIARVDFTQSVFAYNQYLPLVEINTLNVRRRMLSDVLIFFTLTSGASLDI